MATKANLCQGCGAERPADAPDGFCAACLMHWAREADTLVPDDIVATVDPVATAATDPPVATQAGFDPHATVDPPPRVPPRCPRPRRPTSIRMPP